MTMNAWIATFDAVAASDTVGLELYDIDVSHWAEALKVLKVEHDFARLEFITGVDRGDGECEVVALLSDAKARTVAVRSRVRDGQVVASVVDTFPGAAWHERELAEMFGIELSSGPAEHLLLAQDGPEHPLLKSFSLIAEPKAR